jgi:hypothetical protein
MEKAVTDMACEQQSTAGLIRPIEGVQMVLGDVGQSSKANCNELQQLGLPWLQPVALTPVPLKTNRLSWQISPSIPTAQP